MRRLEKSEGTPSYELKVKLCEAIVDYRVQNDMTQNELAEELDVNKSIVSRIAHSQVHFFTADRLVEYLGILGLTVNLKVKGGRVA